MELRSERLVVVDHEVRTNTDGSRDALNVSYQGGVLASITEDNYNPGGSLAESKTWTYSGGSLVSIDEHDNLAGGSTADTEWDYQAGSVAPTSVTASTANPDGSGTTRARNTIAAEAS